MPSEVFTEVGDNMGAPLSASDTSGNTRSRDVDDEGHLPLTAALRGHINDEQDFEDSPL